MFCQPCVTDAIDMMEKLPHVVVVTARCSRKQSDYGIRFEEIFPQTWVADWAFAISSRAAVKEGYTSTTIKGKFEFADAFPGCPYCESKSFFKCSCGRVSCWDGESKKVICPWCRAKVELSGEVGELGAGTDR